MSATDKKQAGVGPVGDMALPVTLIVVGVIAWGVFGALWLGYRWAGLPTDDLLNRVLDGDAGWVKEATYCLVAVGVLLAGLTVLTVVAIVRTKRATRDVDRAVPHMPNSKALAPLTPEGRAADAKAKHLPLAALPNLVRTLDGKWIAGGPESTTTCIAGPRSGKSSTLAITRIVEWDGPVVATSNKRDLVDATRMWRERGANRVWVFDPQGIVRESPNWYWNPITYVIGGGAPGMDIRAARLANRFAFSTGTNTKGGDYFNATGEGLVASLILAAAVSTRHVDRNLLYVRRHLTNPSLREAYSMLQEAGFDHAASALRAIQDLTGDQRDGVYGTADTMTQFLTYQSIIPWITEGPGRTEFNPDLFVRSHDTLHSVSREGQGSMGPLVTALTVAVCEAGEDLATMSPGGRLETPLALVLDEVANVCRWSELPNVYSHYGSKGIILMCFFQSWSQGANVWGDAGMKALWSASTTRLVGPGIAENGFLESVSHMIGDYRRTSVSTSYSQNGRSRSVQEVKDTMLSVADLTAMPFGRMLLVEAGYRPVIVESVPWWKRPYGKELAALQGTAHTRPRTGAERVAFAHTARPVIDMPEDGDEFTTARAR